MIALVRSLSSRWKPMLAASALLFGAAVLARSWGIALVAPLIFLASACAVQATLRLAGCVRLGMRRDVFLAFASRWVLAVVLYCASLYQWPLARSLQAGNGFWYFCMDALNYHNWAPRVLVALQWDLPLPRTDGAIDYYIVVAAIYGLFGSSPLTAIGINILAWTLGTVMLVALFQMLRGRVMPVWLAGVISLWPSGLIWPTQVMKESLVLLMLTLAAWASVHLVRSASVARAVVHAALLLAACVPLLRLRIYHGRILFVSALVTMAVAVAQIAWRREGWPHLAGAAALAALASFAVSFIAAPDPFQVLTPAEPGRAYVAYGQVLEAEGERAAARSAYEQALLIDPDSGHATTALARLALSAGSDELVHDAEAEHLSIGAAARVSVRLAASLMSAAASHGLSAIDSLRALMPDDLGVMRENFASTAGNSAVATDYEVRGWRDVIAFAPRGMITVLLAPLPWDVVRPRGVTGHFRTFAISESLLMMLLLPPMVVGLARLRRPEEIFVALFALAGLFAHSLVITNLGTLFRLRVAFTLLLVGFASYGSDVYPWLARRLRRSSPHSSRATD
jgi:hypothetical protein